MHLKLSDGFHPTRAKQRPHVYAPWRAVMQKMAILPFFCRFFDFSIDSNESALPILTFPAASPYNYLYSMTDGCPYASFASSHFVALLPELPILNVFFSSSSSP